MNNSFLEPYLKAYMNEDNNYSDEKIVSPHEYFIVADDDELISNTIAAEFRQMGYDSTAAFDADTVDQLIRYKKPDVLLMDYYMPGLNGSDFMERLMEKDEYSDIEFMLMSAYPQARDIAKQLGILFFEKPFGIDDVINTLTDKSMAGGFGREQVPASTVVEDDPRRGLRWGDIIELFTKPLD